MKLLKDLIKGDKIQFSRKGLVWIVITRSKGKYRNRVIQLKSENGSFRTYSCKSNRWEEQVFLI